MSINTCTAYEGGCDACLMQFEGIARSEDDLLWDMRNEGWKFDFPKGEMRSRCPQCVLEDEEEAASRAVDARLGKGGNDPGDEEDEPEAPS